MQETKTKGAGLSSPWPLWTLLLEGHLPATLPRPNSTGGARPEVAEDLELLGLVGRSLDRKDVYWFHRDRGPTLTSWGVLQVDQVTREEWQWALQGQLPAPSGWAAIPNVGAQMHLPKGKGKGKEGEGKMVTPGKLERVSLGNVKAVENPFSLGKINEEGRKIPPGAIPCKHNFQTQGLDKSHLGHTM